MLIGDTTVGLNYPIHGKIGGSWIERGQVDTLKHLKWKSVYGRKFQRVMDLQSRL